METLRYTVRRVDYVAANDANDATLIVQSDEGPLQLQCTQTVLQTLAECAHAAHTPTGRLGASTEQVPAILRFLTDARRNSTVGN